MTHLPHTIRAAFIEPDPFPRGHPVRGGYVETFWTPILGPTAVAVARRLAYRLQAAAANSERHGLPFEGIAYPLADLAAEVGASVRIAENKLQLLARQGLAERDGIHYRLAAKWPLVTEEDVARLPRSLRPYARPPAPERVA